MNPSKEEIQSFFEKCDKKTLGDCCLEFITGRLLKLSEDEVTMHSRLCDIEISVNLYNSIFRHCSRKGRLSPNFTLTPLHLLFELIDKIKFKKQYGVGPMAMQELESIAEKVGIKF